MLKRLFDIVCSLMGVIILIPAFIVIFFLIIIDSKGGIFYRQIRVGKSNKDFILLKFRTMRTGSDKKGLLTVGAKDYRITGIGYTLRKYKLDELPQLFNVLFGEMSLVGPRPEVRKYVDMYTEEQKKVLIVKPGITDYASIEYSNENEILAKAEDPEKTYITEIMPHKLELNLKYINDQSFFTDVKIIFKTVAKILG
jgi:lipopolysaccharide/colanic/teichoic acid biosynthesis glycosyltransferase